MCLLGRVGCGGGEWWGGCMILWVGPCPAPPGPHRGMLHPGLPSPGPPLHFPVAALVCLCPSRLDPGWLPFVLFCDAGKYDDLPEMAFYMVRCCATAGCYVSAAASDWHMLVAAPPGQCGCGTLTNVLLLLPRRRSATSVRW